jgi:hypothetical protein
VRRWIVDLIGRLRRPSIDRAALREEMTRTDPDFAHVRDVQHDALGLIGASRNARQLQRRIEDGASLRREREFWERNPRRD